MKYSINHYINEWIPEWLQTTAIICLLPAVVVLFALFCMLHVIYALAVVIKMHKSFSKGEFFKFKNTTWAQYVKDFDYFYYPPIFVEYEKCNLYYKIDFFHWRIYLGEGVNRWYLADLTRVILKLTGLPK